jgi:hypothetical protein
LGNPGGLLQLRHVFDGDSHESRGEPGASATGVLQSLTLLARRIPDDTR